MNDKEIYLSNLEWTKTHDNMGGVKANLIFKDNISYEEFEKILKETFFILNDKRMQSKWNSLREYIEEMKLNKRYDNDVERFTAYDDVLDKMNELEGKDK